MNKSRKFTALPAIILLLFFFSRSSAQISDKTDVYTDKYQLISVGVVAGVNFCQVDGDNYAGYHKISPNFGGIGYFRLKSNLALSFELLYSQKGAKSNDIKFSPLDSTTIITDYRITNNYVEIPLMLNYFDKHKSHFGLGMSYNRLLNTKETMTAIPVYTSDFEKYPFKKDGYNVVASAQMHVWKGLFFNIRFQYGLSPIRTLSPPGLSRAQKQYNNLWTVRLMYVFL